MVVTAPHESSAWPGKKLLPGRLSTFIRHRLTVYTRFPSSSRNLKNISLPNAPNKLQPLPAPHKISLQTVTWPCHNASCDPRHPLERVLAGCKHSLPRQGRDTMKRQSPRPRKKEDGATLVPAEGASQSLLALQGTRGSRNIFAPRRGVGQHSPCARRH